jgi:hypothetical protein
MKSFPSSLTFCQDDRLLADIVVVIEDGFFADHQNPLFSADQEEGHYF